MDQKSAALTTSSPLSKICTYPICVDMLRRLLIKLSCIHFPNLLITEDKSSKVHCDPLPKKIHSNYQNLNFILTHARQITMSDFIKGMLAFPKMAPRTAVC